MKLSRHRGVLVRFGGRMLKILGMLLVIFLMGCAQTEWEEIALEESTIVEEAIQEAEDRIYVYVCGAVKFPGVYELLQGSRVFEAIQAAGGFLGEAAENEVNQAEILKDEMKLYIPTLQDLEEQKKTEAGKVNINIATKEELMTLPGVGESKANQIIQYREDCGKFQSIEDIMMISGIKEGLFNKIKDYITV